MRQYIEGDALRGRPYHAEIPENKLDLYQEAAKHTRFPDGEPRYIVEVTENAGDQYRYVGRDYSVPRSVGPLSEKIVTVGPGRIGVCVSLSPRAYGDYAAFWRAFHSLTENQSPQDDA